MRGPRCCLGYAVKHSAHLASDPRSALVFAESREDKALADVGAERVEGFGHGDFRDFAESADFCQDVFVIFKGGSEASSSVGHIETG